MLHFRIVLRLCLYNVVVSSEGRWPYRPDPARECALADEGTAGGSKVEQSGGGGRATSASTCLAAGSRRLFRVVEARDKRWDS